MMLAETAKQPTERRAVSAVISNMILIAAVIVVGFSVFAWTEYQASTYNSQYSQAIRSDIDQLKERIAFECVFYDSAAKNLTVCLINYGTINGITVQTVYVRFAGNTTLVSAFSDITLTYFNGVKTLTNAIDAGQERLFTIPTDLTAGIPYSIEIVTGRGSKLEDTLFAS